ncbi:CsiV family protein [Nitrococcus mobilis]|uniref:Peptidoglycan-binding protein CsiV n=1 Tax=Nitrococcus mobilis Nb-231 TaxID=314278 RepID=A4BUM6_9GAMM|nr:CsiV family protein [Nitrococcus mobilis]EAR20592.1 hypothetical protein NB231_07332 [Nitrococcus mobilis Nb-231]
MDQSRCPSHRCIVVVLALLLGALATPGLAQNTYAVEVVIFRHWEAPDNDAEFWPHQPPPISRSATQRLVTLGPAASGADAPGFNRLPATKLQLAGIHQRLARSNDYRVLLHVGWRQPGLKPNNAAAVVLPLNWFPPAQLTAGAGASQNPFESLPQGTRLWGTLRLLQRRYLHFQVDLRYRRDGARAGDAATVYPMTQSRRMRVGEIHYLDHPVLGILVQVRQLN